MSGDWVLEHEAVATEHLQAAGNDVLLLLGGPVLGHGSAGLVQLASVVSHNSLVNESLQGGDAGSDVSQVVAVNLVLDDRATECLALLSVLVSQGPGAAGSCDRAASQGQALVSEVGAQVAEGSALFAEQVLSRNADVVEVELSGVLSLQADLL